MEEARCLAVTGSLAKIKRMTKARWSVQAWLIIFPRRRATRDVYVSPRRGAPVRLIATGTPKTSLRLFYYRSREIPLRLLSLSLFLFPFWLHERHRMPFLDSSAANKASPNREQYFKYRRIFEFSIRFQCALTIRKFISGFRMSKKYFG